MLTTHYLEEADALAGRVIVIDHGLVIADDTAAALKSALGDLASLEFATVADAMAGAAAADRIPGAQVTVTDTSVRVRAPFGRDAAPRLVADLAGAGTPVTRLEVVGPTLDDVFLNLTGRSLRESNDTAGPIDTVGAAGDQHEGEAA